MTDDRALLALADKMAITEVIYRAQSQCYLLAHHLMSADCPPFPPLFPHTGRPYAVLVGARYHDRFERRDGEWKILQRTLHFEWDAPIPIPAVSGPLANTQGVVPGIF